jgi:hypothetical protein
LKTIILLNQMSTIPLQTFIDLFRRQSKVLPEVQINLTINHLLNLKKIDKLSLTTESERVFQPVLLSKLNIKYTQ